MRSVFIFLFSMVDVSAYVKERIALLPAEQQAVFTHKVKMKLVDLLRRCTDAEFLQQQLELTDKLIDRIGTHTTQQLDLSDKNKIIVHNGTLAHRMKTTYTTKEFDELIKLLEQHNALSIQTHEASLDYYGEKKTMTVLQASAGEGYNMTDVRLRDQAFAALSMYRVRSTDTEKNTLEGEKAKKLFLSLLDMVSAEGEMDKVDGLIANKADKEYMASNENHPSIKWGVDKNSKELERVEDWAHKQDARQQLVAGLIEAIEGGLLTVADLDEHHKEWLGKITDLAAALDYTTCLDAGSREEIDAHRTSTMICTLYGLLGLQRLSQREDFAFLQDQEELREKLIDQGVEEAKKTLLVECPNEKKNSAAARVVDATGLYTLSLDTTNQLFELLGQGAPSPHEVYKHIQNHLYDPTTGGIKRYLRDSYQGNGMYQVWDLLTGEDGLWKDPVFKDTHGYIHFLGRKWMLDIYAKATEQPWEELEAGWTHPHFQIASWASRKYCHMAKEASKESDEMKRLYDLAIDEGNKGLAMMTGGNEYVLRPQENAPMTIEKVAARQLPEARIYHTGSDKRTVTTTGPWLPLFRAVSGGKETMATIRKMIATREEKYVRKA